MQTNMETATSLLFGSEGLLVSNIKLFPGTDRDSSPEEISSEVVNAVRGIMAGDFVDVTDCEE